MESSSIRVRFSTEYEEFRVTDTPFAVPTRLGRKGLSEVINHLINSLNANNDDQSINVEFDFVINDILLRTSLRKFLELSKQSNEEVLSITYMPALHLPDETTSTEMPAWVGCIDTNIPSIVAAGCYDGQLQLFDAASNTIKTSSSIHQRAIRCLSSLTTESGHSYVFTGSKDHTVKVHSLIHSKNKKKSVSLSQTAILKAHSNSVESMSIASIGGSDILLTGDWGGNIFGWSISSMASGNQVENDNDDEEAAVTSRKKKRTSSGTAAPVQDMKPLFTLRGHNQCVSDLHGGGGSSAYSCGWDHSVREWDVERQDCVFTGVGTKVVTSLHKFATSSTVLTSHTDGRLRLWDVREGGQSQRGAFSSDSPHWIAQVRCHPHSSLHFASIDYDGQLSLWDMRSSTPIGTKSAHSGKGLCLAWSKYLSSSSSSEKDAEMVRLWSGGADCVLAATYMKA